jgi:hypothetical protein
MILVKFFAAFFLFVLILTSCSNEPEPIPTIPTLKATIKGIVRDADTGEPIYYATVFTVPPSIETQTGINGDFILNDIWPKEYMVYGYLQGFDNDSDFVSLHDGDTADVNMYLNNFSEYIDYYPLDIGNYWEYWSGDVPRFSLEVISDTMISGKMYRVIKDESLLSQNIEYRYERVDGYNAVVYRYFPLEEKEMLIDSLPAKAGQIFTSNVFMDPYAACCSICFSIETEEIFGEIRKVRNLKQFCGNDMPDYQIVNGIGFYSAVFFRNGGYTLKYAVIKGVEYGGN